MHSLLYIWLTLWLLVKAELLFKRIIIQADNILKAGAGCQLRLWTIQLHWSQKVSLREVLALGPTHGKPGLSRQLDKSRLSRWAETRSEYWCFSMAILIFLQYNLLISWLSARTNMGLHGPTSSIYYLSVLLLTSYITPNMCSKGVVHHTYYVCGRSRVVSVQNTNHGNSELLLQV